MRKLVPAIVLAAAFTLAASMADVARAQTSSADEPATVEEVQNLAQRAEQGDPEAQFRLAEVYLGRIEIPQAQARGLALMRHAADGGHAQAQYELARLHHIGLHGVAIDNAVALEWYRAAAENGSAAAAITLGEQYNDPMFYSLGLRPDRRQANQWLQRGMTLYRRDADRGDAEAQYQIGFMYFRGQGVRQDYAQALSWYRRAADQGHLQAMEGLGGMYQYGIGVPQDTAQARVWYQRAAQNDPNPYSDSLTNALLENTEQDIAAARLAEQQRAQLEAQNAAEVEALTRLLTGGLVALADGDERQIAQALTGQEITASPPPPLSGPYSAPSTGGGGSPGAVPGGVPTYGGATGGGADYDTSTHNQCIQPIRDGPGFGSFENGCDYAVEIVYCVLSPNQGAWSDAFSCAEQKIGMLTVPANRRAAAHNRGGEGVYYLACRIPATPRNSVFEPGRGIVARCG